MAKIKVSNGEVIATAKREIHNIQSKRHEIEARELERIKNDFEFYDKKWAYSVDITEWIKDFDPFAIIFLPTHLLFYPFIVMKRHFILRNKPKTDHPYLMAEWTEKMMDDSIYMRLCILESTYADKTLRSCHKLKCMAENNEEDYMWIDSLEAENLGIC